MDAIRFGHVSIKEQRQEKGLVRYDLIRKSRDHYNLHFIITLHSSDREITDHYTLADKDG